MALCYKNYYIRPTAHFCGKGKPHLLIPTHKMGVAFVTPTLWLLFEAYSTVHFLNLSFFRVSYDEA